MIIWILTFLCTTFNVWFVHWLLHRKSLRQLYVKHIRHHNSNMNDKFLFSRISIPWLIGIVILVILGVYSVIFGTLVLLSTIFWMGLHDFLHHHFHLKDSFLNEHIWFQKLRQLHFLHHGNMNTNFGILFFGWDRLLGTFKKR